MSLDLVIQNKGTRIEKPINKVQTQKILKESVELFHNPNSIIHEEVRPQTLIPKSIKLGSEQHANYLLTLAVCDSQNKSRVLYPKIKQTAQQFYSQNQKHLFDLETLCEFDSPGHLQETLETFDFKLAPPKKHTFLVENARYILENFPQGQISQFDMINNYDVNQALLYFKNKNLQGIGGQTGALLLQYMIESGIWNFENKEELPPKVDVHKLRLPFALGFYSIPKQDPLIVHKDSIIPQISAMYLHFAKELSLELELTVSQTTQGITESLWTIGEQYCSQADLRVCEEKCPFFSSCQGLPYFPSGSRVYSKNKALKKEQELVTQGIHPLIPLEEQEKGELNSVKSKYDRISKQLITVDAGKICINSDVRTDSKIQTKDNSKQLNLF